jgi:hypothetical protein
MIYKKELSPSREKHPALLEANIQINLIHIER